MNKWDCPTGPYLQGNEPLSSHGGLEITNCLLHRRRWIINIRPRILEDCIIARDHGRANVDIDSPNSYMGDSKTKRIIRALRLAIIEDWLDR